MKRIVFWLIAFCMVLSFAGCSSEAAANTEDTEETTASDAQEDSVVYNEENSITTDIVGENEMNPVVIIEMDNGMTINVELYPDKAPNTVNNFISLIKQGYYDGLTFHRIIDGFMIQGGCPEGTGMGNPGYSIAGEFSSNGFEGNDISHTAGVISMARSSDMDSAGSQFFIMVGTATYLDGEYAAFGKVIDEESLNNCLELAQVEVSGDSPVDPPVIKSIKVDTKGVDYEEPNHS